MTLTVIIPTLNAANVLPICLAALDPSDEIVITDGGSRDATVEIATQFGAEIVTGPRGRGVQMDAGSRYASGVWLLFLHADTVLAPSWRSEVARFIAERMNENRAAVFRFGLDDESPAARRLEAIVAWRCRWLRLPYGDQGLLIRREFYRNIGGFRPMPIMEDVDMIRRIGRENLTILKSTARTSAAKWRRDGWWLRSLRNLSCLGLYFLGLPPRIIRSFYG